MVTTPTYIPLLESSDDPESLPRIAHSPAGCVGSHRLPRFTLLRSLSMSRAHPQPLLGFRSIPATSAFFEPVRVCQPLRAPFLQLSAEASTAPVQSTIVTTSTKPHLPASPAETSSSQIPATLLCPIPNTPSSRSLAVLPSGACLHLPLSI